MKKKFNMKKSTFFNHIFLPLINIWLHWLILRLYATFFWNFIQLCVCVCVYAGEHFLCWWKCVSASFLFVNLKYRNMLFAAQNHYSQLHLFIFFWMPISIGKLSSSFFFFFLLDSRIDFDRLSLW